MIDATALILAGGRATRFGGVAKHAIVVAGETILARQVRVLAPLVREIIVAAPQDVAGYRTVRDVAGASGPLAGIAAGLAAIATEWLLIVAGDMPDITTDAVAVLLGDTAGDANAFIVNGLPEPLFCCVRVAPARIAIARLLAERRYKASGLLEALAVHWMPGEPVRAALRNINTPEDLKREI